MNDAQAVKSPCVCVDCPSSLQGKLEQTRHQKIRLFLTSILPGQTTLAELEMIEAHLSDTVESRWKPT